MDIKVLIGVPMGEMGRYNQFHNYLSLIHRPPNTETGLIIGRSAAENRNIIIEQALAKECSHVLFLDDDMAPEPDILYRLLRHKMSIVSGLYFTRKHPHDPVAFSKFGDDNIIEWLELKNGESGLIKIEAAGLGACLIETSVFRNMEKPWIRYGEIGKLDSWCHDIGFFRRARKQGFFVWCDLDCHVGHIGEAVIKPKQIDGKWYFAYSPDGNNEIGSEWMPHLPETK